MQQLGFSYTKPTYTLAKADPVKQGTFKEAFEAVKKLNQQEIDHILFEDESMIRDYQAISNTWFPEVTRKSLKPMANTTESSCWVFLITPAEIYFVWKKNDMTHKSFCPFWNRLLIDIQTRDLSYNARIHHAKLIQPFLQAYAEHLQLMFLPPYSPDLNPIEGLWGWLKKSVIYNVFYSSLAEIRDAVQSFISEISKDRSKILARLCTRI